MKKVSIALLLTLTALGSAWAQHKHSGDHDRHDNRTRFETKRSTNYLASGDELTVDAGRNGGVSVSGWDKNSIEVTAKIQTWANNDAAARDLADQIEVSFEGTIHAMGPEQQRNAGWSVSFELKVPQESDLNLSANNGGISISQVNGAIRFTTKNGGINLDRVAGDVDGSTTNGGVRVVLDGDSWQGDGLKVKTVNGGIAVDMPEQYAADLRTSTVNGRVRSDFAEVSSKRGTKRLDLQLSGGGMPIELRTTNGGIVFN